MSCTNCNENNSVPLPVGVTDPCSPCTSPCNACGECTCTCSDPGYMTDGCYSTQGSSCVTYEGDDITCATITKGSLLTLVIQKLFNYTKNVFTRITSSSLVITRPDTSCDDTAAIELVPSTDANNALTMGTDGHPYVPVSTQTSPALVPTDSQSIDFTATGTLGHNLTATVRLNPTNNLITVGPTGLLVPDDAYESALTFDNALTRTADNIQFGGDLVIDTNVNLLAKYLQINNTYGSTKFTATATNSTLAMGNTSGDLFTSFRQLGNSTRLLGSTVANIASTNYYAESLFKINPVTSEAVIGSIYPDGSSAPATKLTTAYFKTLPYKATVEGNEILLSSPQRSITAGGLVSGKKYLITGNGGSADFTPSGAAANTVGTIFTSNGTTPTWGTGSLEVLGTVDMEVPYAAYHLERSTHIVTAYSPASAPNDYGLINIKQPGYYETQIFTSTQRGNVSYTTEAVNILRSESTGMKVAKTGVSSPTTNDILQPAPAATQYASYTEWLNDPTGSITQGHMRTTSPYATFIGVSGVNSSITKVGINNTLPTAPLDIVGLNTGPSLRLRTSFIPASSTAAGNAGDITWGVSGGIPYLFLCIATNTWRRVAFSTTSF